MKSSFVLIAALFLASSGLTAALALPKGDVNYEQGSSSRRHLFQSLLSSAVLGTTLGTSTSASATENDPLIDCYFGCGCFWHVQHEFVEAERKLLGRKDMQLSARAGYAGGKVRVCNLNMLL